MVGEKRTFKKRIPVKRKFLIALSLGTLLLLVPLLLILTDPMFLIAKYKFRLASGSILHELLQSEMEGGRFAVYLFNITNAENFLSGRDYKLKLEEIGPFTYVEYRLHDKLQMDSSRKVMRYTPKIRSVFVPEESIGYPEDVRITMPNIPMLSATSMVRSSPYVIRILYNMVVSQLNSKSIVSMDAKRYLWGYEDPVLTMANNIVPGVIHFNSTGVMDRMYDRNVVYQMELGTTDEDKFQIKRIKKFKPFAGRYSEPESFTEFNDTYEGMAYPPKITPETPINIYRVGICKSFKMEICGRKSSEYGANAFVYKFKDQMFNNENLCNSKGLCPKGVLDLSKCFYGLPMGLSKGHLLDADPEVLNRLEGLKPDPEAHTSYMVIEPKIGLTLETSFSLQANILTGDMSYNADASAFSDMVIPIAHFKIKQPELPAIAVRALRMMYVTVPFVLFITEIILVIVGLLVLVYCARLIYCNFLFNTDIILAKDRNKTLYVEQPLLQK